MKRTVLQNRALHRWLTLTANSLNDAGYDQKLLLDSVSFEIPNTPESLKDIFRSIAVVLYPGLVSTAELSSSQIQRVYEVMDKEIGYFTSISIPWPQDTESFGEHSES